jgi:translation elongation factor EF-Ts
MTWKTITALVDLDRIHQATEVLAAAGIAVKRIRIDRSEVDADQCVLALEVEANGDSDRAAELLKDNGIQLL